MNVPANASAPAPRSRGPRLAVLAPRFHPEIVGGSEQYLFALCEGLVARGLELEVVTTRSLSVEFDTHHVIRWRSQAVDETALPGMTIHRCAAWNLPEALESRLERAIDAGATRARRGLPLFAGRSYLGRGFHQLEHSTTVGWFRWSSPRANLVVGEPDAAALSLLVHVLVPTTLEARCDGSVLFRERLSPDRQRQIVLRLPRPGPCVVELRCSPPYQPPGEKRRLGVGVAALGVLAGATEIPLPLDRDEAALESTLTTATLAAHLDALAQRQPRGAALADALLKGPWGLRLAGMALRVAARADAVLATNAPYSTLALGWLAARLARRPFLALPFLHLRDAYHHRPQIRGPLRRADLVFCLDESGRRFVESAWSTRALVLGAGVNLEELSAPGISGARFRARHGLGDDPLVLQVARKTPGKGYRKNAEAVARLRERGSRARFVLIGPDEDSEPLASPGAVYLGRVDRSELLDALDACDVFSLPSLHESFGLAYLEAWLRGKPVVGHARCDAACELITANEDGELVADVDELTAALARLLDDPARAAAMGARGRANSLGRHTWQQVADRAAAAIRELIGAGR